MTGSREVARVEEHVLMFDGRKRKDAVLPDGIAV